MMPKINLENSEQNAWVQDWITQYYKKFPDEQYSEESVIEAIQETYDYQDHEWRKGHATNADLIFVSEFLRKFYSAMADAGAGGIPMEHDTVQAIALAGAFLASIAHHSAFAAKRTPE